MYCDIINYHYIIVLHPGYGFASLLYKVLPELLLEYLHGQRRFSYSILPESSVVVPVHVSQPGVALLPEQITIFTRQVRILL